MRPSVAGARNVADSTSLRHLYVEKHLRTRRVMYLLFMYLQNSVQIFKIQYIYMHIQWLPQ